MKKVLVIEDTVSEQEKIKAILEPKGVEVISVLDYFTATHHMDLIEQGHYDVILWDGVVMYRLARPKDFVYTTPLVRQARRSNPNVFMVTMSKDEHLRNEHFAIGCNLSIEKKNAAKTVLTYLTIE